MTEDTGWKLTIDGALARLTLSRPQVANSVDDATIAAGARCMERLAVEPGVRVVLISGEGKHFSAGADIHWMKRSRTFTAEQNLADARALSRFLDLIQSCPRPVVARIHGSALGAGSGITAAADISIAARTATFGFTEVRLGIVPAVISPFVLRRLTPGTAQALFLTGERFDGQRAYDVGLVDKVVAEEDLDAMVATTVKDLLSGGDAAHATVKELVAGVVARPLKEAREFTTATLARVRTGEEAREGLSSFLEKRKASWCP